MLCTKQSSNWVKSHECNVHKDHVRADFPWGSIKSARCLRGSSLSADCSLGSRQSSDCSWLSHKGQANQLIVHEDESISWILMAITWGSSQSAEFSWLSHEDQVNQLIVHEDQVSQLIVHDYPMRIMPVSWLFTPITWGSCQSADCSWGSSQSADCSRLSHEDEASQAESADCS